MENKWIAKFSKILSGASIENAGYFPGWYSGAGWSTLVAAGFPSNITGSISGSISAASTSPGSTSGGGGGGGGD